MSVFTLPTSRALPRPHYFREACAHHVGYPCQIATCSKAKLNHRYIRNPFAQTWHCATSQSVRHWRTGGISIWRGSLWVYNVLPSLLDYSKPCKGYNINVLVGIPSMKHWIEENAIESCIRGDGLSHLFHADLAESMLVYRQSLRALFFKGQSA